jgi:hypothetical protein
MRRFRSFVVTAVVVAAALLSVAGATAGSGGVSGPAFYVDGVLYRTVGTPTDLSGTGAPAHSYDVIYNLGGAQRYNIATAAPGDPGFNGGRWQVHRVTFADYGAAVAAHDANGSGDLDSAGKGSGRALIDGAGPNAPAGGDGCAATLDSRAARVPWALSTPGRTAPCRPPCRPKRGSFRRAPRPA